MTKKNSNKIPSNIRLNKVIKKAIAYESIETNKNKSEIIAKILKETNFDTFDFSELNKMHRINYDNESTTVILDKDLNDLLTAKAVELNKKKSQIINLILAYHFEISFN